MLKGHPRALYVAFFANMGERFGFYTMMACLVFFLQARYGLGEDVAGDFYSWFYFFIYGLAVIGGLIADKTKAYKGTIFVGIVTMLAGYILMATPGLTLYVTLSALMIIAFGNGLFKGNLQAIVGQMYDDEKYKKFRDSAFMIFYMGINVGAFFAPSAANGVRNWYMKTQGYAYDADLSKLATKFNQGLLENTTEYEALIAQLGYQTTDITAFSQEYMNVFSTGYNYAFGVAAFAMLISMLVFVIFQKMLPSKKMQDAEHKEKGTAVEMPWSEEKPRLIALGLVFLVVIFFWMSFHQNGLTLSFFARDYTDFEVSRITNIFFDLKAFLSLIAAVIGLILLFRKNVKATWKFVGAAMVVAGAALTYYFAATYGELNRIEPELFQQFNPIFIVFLTPVIIGFFAYLKKRNKEPSTPRKIGIGMIIATLGFVLMIFASIGLVSPNDLGGDPAPGRVSVYWLIDTYLILTIAELFLSPIGISFVSKVSPPRFQGLMQGGWLFATAIGNKLLFVGSELWVRIELWQLWSVFVVCCLLSAIFIFSIMKRLERLTDGH
jgi:POT family proton-dependent oligopeptide transporter